MPGIRDLRKVNSKDSQLNKVQDNLSEFVRPFVDCVLLDGRLIKAIEVTTGETSVEHKLGRELLGYIIVSKSATCDIWDSQSTNLLKSKTLVLQSSAPATISLWCF